MTVMDQVIQKLGKLPAEQQREVLDYVDSLQRRQMEPSPETSSHDPEGLLVDQPSQLDLQQFAEARRELWQRFPRE
jgi:hypothetical protein